MTVKQVLTTTLIWHKRQIVHIIWVKRHAEIPGNNIVDNLAKQVTNLPDTSNEIVEYLDTINLGKNGIWKKILSNEINEYLDTINLGKNGVRKIIEFGLETVSRKNPQPLYTHSSHFTYNNSTCLNE